MRHHGVDCIVLMVNFVVFVETGHLVEGPMHPDVYEVVHQSGNHERLEDFCVGWEALEFHGSQERSQGEVERIQHEINKTEVFYS
jgi:hypothetical protein